MRRIKYYGWLLCLLLSACHAADRTLPTLMAFPLLVSPTSAAPQATLTAPVLAATQERTRAAIVLTDVPTATLTATELPLLPTLAATATPTGDDLSSTLAALTAAPTSASSAERLQPCEGLQCLFPPVTAGTVNIAPTKAAIPLIVTPLVSPAPGTEISGAELPPSATPTATPTVGAWYTQNHVHAKDATTLYEGPGTTYPVVGVLNPDIEARIVERNRIGNWLHVRQSDNGETLLDGWVLIGPLLLEKGLRFSQVPVNESLPDADMAQVRLQTTAPLYAAPVIPYISEAMREVYLRGQRLGIRSQSITKIGDSVSANPLYLDLISRKDTLLGPYDYLSDTLAYFKDSRKLLSVAAKKGMSSYSIFDPLMADKVCQPDESPLVCELRLRKPAVAFIMFGPNDIRAMEVKDYKAQMSLLVEDLLANGTIPVLTTFSADPSRRTWQKSMAFNLALLDVARTYDVPLMNLWLASRDLPKYGLEGDGIHMRNFGYEYLKLDAGFE